MIVTGTNVVAGATSSCDTSNADANDANGNIAGSIGNMLMSTLALVDSSGVESGTAVKAKGDGDAELQSARQPKQKATMTRQAVVPMMMMTAKRCAAVCHRNGPHRMAQAQPC